jgi:hypothetical protein
MAEIRAKIRRRPMGRREDELGEDRQDERFVLQVEKLFVLLNNSSLTESIDQQIGQLYELMQAIKKQAKDDADAETARFEGSISEKDSQ